MWEYVIVSTTNPPTIVIAKTLFGAIHKAYETHNIVQDNIYGVIKGRKQEV